jgi:thioredoxin 1
MLFGTAGDLCGCFGDIIPLTHTQSLMANIAMAGISLYLLFRPSKSSFKGLSRRALAAARPLMAIILISTLLMTSLPATVYASTSKSPAQTGDPGKYVINVNPETGVARLEDGIKPTLMYFYNEDCANCQQQQPIIDALEQEYGSSFNLQRIDSGTNREILKTYNITRVPTMLVVSGDQSGDVRQKFVGVTGEDALLSSLVAARTNSSSSLPDNEQSQNISTRDILLPPSEGEDTDLSLVAYDEPTRTEIVNIAAPSGQILEWNGGINTFGPNAAITISLGTILTVNSCGDDGYNDNVYPYADIYIVPSGSVEIGDDLTDVTGYPLTVVAFGGVFVDEIVAYTYPGGQVPPGTYAIVYDECQDGDLDAIDALFDPAFHVTYNQEVPPLPSSFYTNKIVSQETAQITLQMAGELQALFDALDLYNDAKGVVDCALDPAACLKDFLADKLKEEIMKAIGLDFDVKEVILTHAINMARHYLSIAADPPNPDFQHLTYLSRWSTVFPATIRSAGYDPTSEMHSMRNAPWRTLLPL